MESTKKHAKHLIHNVTADNKSSLTKLRSSDDIIVKKTDKSKALSIQNKCDYKEKILSEHVSDSSTYTKLDTKVNPIPSIETKINKLWNSISKRNNLPVRA